MDQDYQNLTDAEKESQIIKELKWLLKFQLKNINFTNDKIEKYGDSINKCMNSNTPYLTSLAKKAEQQNANSTPNNKRKLSFETVEKSNNKNKNKYN